MLFPLIDWCYLRAFEKIVALLYRQMKTMAMYRIGLYCIFLKIVSRKYRFWQIRFIYLFLYRINEERKMSFRSGALKYTFWNVCYTAYFRRENVSTKTMPPSSIKSDRTRARQNIYRLSAESREVCYSRFRSRPRRVVWIILLNTILDRSNMCPLRRAVE